MKPSKSFAVLWGVLTPLVFLFSSMGWASDPVLKFEPATGKVEFLAVGRPSAIKIRGEGPGPTGEIVLLTGKPQGKFSFNLSALNTGIDLRDQHMKEKYLEVGKSECSSVAQLEVISAGLPADWKPGLEGDASFDGKLTLHCLTKPVKGKFHLSKNGNDGVLAQAEFELSLTDYAISIPSYLGIKVADTVKVNVETRSAGVGVAH